MSDELHDNCACREYNELASRREFILKSGGAVGATAFAVAFPEWLPQVSIADAFVSNRDVVVSIFLRGGADGLTLCVPYGDPEYYTGRPTLAIPRPDSSATDKAIALDNMFGLPQNLSALFAAYQAGNLAVIHGAGLTYVVWGLYYGVLIAGYQLAGLRGEWKATGRFRTFFAWLVMFALIAFGWLIFRAPSITWLSEVFMRSEWTHGRDDWIVASIVLSRTAFYSLPLAVKYLLDQYVPRGFIRPFYYAALTLSVVIYTGAGITDFIYFQF